MYFNLRDAIRNDKISFGNIDIKIKEIIKAEMMKAKAAQQKVIQDGQAKGAQLMLEAAKVSQKDRELDLKEQELVLKAGLEVLDTKINKDHNDNTLQLEAIRMVKDAVQADKKLEADLHKTRLQAKKKEPAAKN